MDSWSTRAQPCEDFFVAEEPVAYGGAHPTVYPDTSIPSYLTSRTSGNFAIRRRQRITRIWWDRYRGNYGLWVSELVLSEARAGDAAAAQERPNAMDGLDVLEPNEQSDALVTRLFGKGLLPPKARADAEHIAMAAVNSIQFLLTWNCKHLANLTIHRGIVRMCEAHGFRCPDICTPEKLMRTSTHERSTA
jgi:hypothetical protein